MNYIIKDWAGNIMFGGETFKEFDDAVEYLTEQIEQRIGVPETEAEEENFAIEFGEYYIDSNGGDR